MNCVYFNAKKREKKFHLKKEKYLPPKCRGKNENAATTKRTTQRIFIKTDNSNEK